MTGWFDVRQASVSYDHPFSVPLEHALNIDFVNEALGPGARVAVELSTESAKALVDTIQAVLARAEAGGFVGPSGLSLGAAPSCRSTWSKPICFSPTRTTARIVAAIAHGTQLPAAEPLDLTPPEARTRRIRGGAGRAGDHRRACVWRPDSARSGGRLRRLRAHETPAGIVVVYGNRAYEDALLELRDLVIEQGFIPIAAAAFIGEHSYSTEVTPIAHGRPDVLDLAQAQEFGALIRDRLAAPGVWRRTSPLPVPGAYPHREWIPPTDVAPVTNEALCLRCGDCAHACPTAAIAIGEVVLTNPAACILCTACVKTCPTGARTWDHPRISRSREWLSASCRERKNPELYV